MLVWQTPKFLCNSLSFQKLSAFELRNGQNHSSKIYYSWNGPRYRPQVALTIFGFAVCIVQQLHVVRLVWTH